jgi:hypothetical protein
MIPSEMGCTVGDIVEAYERVNDLVFERSLSHRYVYMLEQEKTSSSQLLVFYLCIEFLTPQTVLKHRWDNF